MSAVLDQPGTLKDELKHIARHGGTVYVGQLAVMLYAVADSVIAGRYNAQALAAFSVATAIYASVFIALMGVMQALMPVYAENHGANRPTEVGVAWRQSHYLLLGLTAVGSLFLAFAGPLLDFAKVPQDMRHGVQVYLWVQILALPLSLGFRAFASLSQAIGRPRVVMWIQLASLPLKIAFSSWFVFGGWGMPAQGAAGCAWGSVVVFTLMGAAALWMLKSGQAYSAIKAWQPMESPNWPQLRAYLRLGLPSGGAMFFEVASFTLMAVLIARLGVQASAAHQVAVNVASVVFMLPLSLSIAASARISYWIGAEQPLHASKVAVLALKLTALSSLCVAVLLVGAAPLLAKAYTPDLSIQQLATVLLYWVAAFTWLDAIQTICAFSLRSYRVTVMPFVVYAVVLWGMGLGGGMLLTYQGVMGMAAWQSPTGFWAAGVAALALTAAAFVLMLFQALRRSVAAGQAAPPAPLATAG